MSSPPHVPIWPGPMNTPRGPGPYRVGAFATCPQLEGFAYEAKLRPAIERDEPKIGTLVHAALAYHYGARLPQRPDWMIYGDSMQAIAFLGADRPDLVYEAQRIFAWYVLFYQNDPWQPILVEHAFQWWFDEHTPITARVDLIAVENGEYVLVDHKVKGKIYRSTGEVMRNDRQMVTCLALARANGWDIRRVVINGMTRDYPEPKFGRYDVPVSAEVYDRFAADTYYFMRRRQEVKAAFPDPMNRPRNTDSCLRKFGPCDFLPLCTEGLVRIHDFVRKS